jgi:hypothetical protein
LDRSPNSQDDPALIPGEHTQEEGPAEGSREDMVQKTMTHVAEQMMMTVRSGPSRDPFIEKMDGAHIHKVLDNSHALEKRQQWVIVGMAVLAAVAVFSLCWLFLAYGKPEHVSAIIALLVGLFGGYGLGVGWQKSRSE